MRKFYSAIRRFTLIVIISAITIYLLAFILLSTPGIQDKVRETGVKELSNLLGSEVAIDHIQITPFNKLALYGICLADKQGDTLLHAHKISAGITLSKLLFEQELVFTNIQLFGADVRITQSAPGSPTNLQFIIDALRSKEEKPKNSLKFRINNAIIRQGKVRYDLLSAPHRNDGQFDPHHIEIENLRSKLSVKALTPDSINVSVKRLGFDEQSGFSLTRLQLRLEGNTRQVQLSEFELRLPNSSIKLAPLAITLPDTLSPENLYRHTPINLRILPGTLVPDDWSALVPTLADIYTPLNLSACTSGTLNNLSIEPLELNFGNGDIVAQSKIRLKEVADSARREISAQAELSAVADGISELAQLLPLTTSQRDILGRLGDVGFNGTIQNTRGDFTACGKIESGLGDLHADILLGNNGNHENSYRGLIETDGFDLNRLFAPGNPYGEIAFQVEFDSNQHQGEAPTGNLTGSIDRFVYKGYPYENILLDGEFGDNRYDGIVQIDDPNGRVEIKGVSILKNKNSEFNLTICARDIHPAELKLLPQYPQSQLGFNLAAHFIGNKLDNAEGIVELDSLTFAYNDTLFTLKQFDIEARNQQSPQSITITSDFLNGKIEGEYQFSELINSLQNLIAESLPSLFPQTSTNSSRQKQNNSLENNFNFRFTIEPNIHMAEVFNLPITFTDQASILGEIDSRTNTCLIESTIPHFWLKKSHFEGTLIHAQKTIDNTQLSIKTKSYNKKQIPTSWSLQSQADQDSLDFNLHWDNSTQTQNIGEIKIASHFSRLPESKQLLIESLIKPSTIVINDSAWAMQPAKVTFCDNRLEVNNFEVSHGPQYIRMAGAASKENEEEELTVELNNMSLDYIFETLNIKHVVFGGKATGEIVASHLFTQAPHLNTKAFQVENFSYNKADLGNLNLFSEWNTENQGILLEGVIENPENRDTQIQGHIFPTQDSLYLAFKPDRLNVAFLRPFIGKVMDNVSGVASGEVDFYGHFKRLNVKGDAFLEEVSFGIKQLNTRYTLTDHIHMSPTAIWFDNVTVYDKNKHTARGSGRIEHKHFKEMTFDIAISDIQDLLAYDVNEQQSPRYFGSIFASSGNVSITGKPGATSINVTTTAGDNSTFSFDLSGNASANDYDFITFTNSKREAAEKEKKAQIDIAEVNNALMIEAINEKKERSGIFDLKLDVTVDNQTQIALITDKNTGDKIKATGEGNVLLSYNSTDSNIDLQGTYTIDQGNYNFSLQDIISRNFIIEKNSKVEFHGDPMATSLNITAHFPLHATLLDLDENFADDPNLQQTTQLVHAILHISGDVRRPDLSFDVKFPNLERTSPDVVRRIESLISTDEMKTRQIIYLLALKRFYTPEYMNTESTRNNSTGLASVASSTLSQLTGLLGALSDNWDIAPNFHTETGDFSDMEVELALSSQLLHNRLIFNGNFGYRNNTVNNNTFIGDFDLEYLLNKSGTIRLKAYNHYNDQKYTIKSALTTQGVGIMFRRDFDKWRNLFRPEKEFLMRLFKRKSKKEKELQTPQENSIENNSAEGKSNENRK